MKRPAASIVTDVESSFIRHRSFALRTVFEVVTLPHIERLDQIAPFIAKIRIAKRVSQTDWGADWV